MKRIFLPTQAPSDWQRFLAKPSIHWKKSYSSMTTAACWEAAGDELPAEVKQTLETSGRGDLIGLKLLAAIPEWEVDLPGGKRPSHTDVLALARNEKGLVVLGVEAKVDVVAYRVCSFIEFPSPGSFSSRKNQCQNVIETSNFYRHFEY